METWQIILLILIVLGVVVGNISLLKYSAKFDMKKFNQDPIEKAKQSLEEKEKSKKG